MSNRRKPPCPDIPDHVPDFASLPPAPDGQPAVLNIGEVHSLIAGILGQDPAEVADVTLICRMNDSLPTTYVWNSAANEPGTGRAKRLMLVCNVLGSALNLLLDQLRADEADPP